MKTLKRLLLRPFYAIYWLWARFVKNELYIKTFNAWLSANGFWRLSTALDNFKVIVPKEYRDFVKKYPNTPFIKHLGAMGLKLGRFTHYENKK